MRNDGRKFNELRPMEAKIGVLKNAVGSAYFKMGNTIAIAGVFGPREVHPKHDEDAEKAILRTRYNMASFSTETRNRPGPSRRSKEISMVIRNALTPVLFLEDYPKTAIDVYIEVLQADASTRCVSLNAATLALADAGVPMRDFVASCSAGKVGDKIVLDIAGKEDTDGQVDLPVAYYPKKRLLTLIQMDGIVTKDELKTIVSLAKKGCEQIYEVQKKVIKEKYKEVGHNDNS
ncbi:MAG: exosome complex exonuclease Rrp41 [Candidatus Aenigmarchaeota archaeon]|nr:exosome complex exonuclease Rrp41 [Candidatus Aenigmarchaeota archaeon]